MNGFMAYGKGIEAHTLCRKLIEKHVKKCSSILEAGTGSGGMLRELS